VLAFKLTDAEKDSREDELLWSAGYGDKEGRGWYVFMSDNLRGGCSEANTDPYNWGSHQELHFVHRWLRDGGGWDKCASGDALLVDLETGYVTVGLTDSPGGAFSPSNQRF
jgi:hypothetical protein